MTMPGALRLERPPTTRQTAAAGPAVRTRHTPSRLEPFFVSDGDTPQGTAFRSNIQSVSGEVPSREEAQRIL